MQLGCFLRKTDNGCTYRYCYGWSRKENDQDVPRVNSSASKLCMIACGVYEKEEKMRGFNKVVLMGNLTRDPELRTTPSGQNVTSFSLAVNRSWKNAQGETQEAVDYIDCNVWGKPAEIVNQYMKKGSGILVSGRLQQRSWEQEGQKRSKVEVVVEDFNFVGGDRDGGSGSTGSSSSSSSSSKPASSKKSEPVVEDIGDEPINLDDIPF